MYRYDTPLNIFQIRIKALLDKALSVVIFIQQAPYKLLIENATSQ